MLSWTRCLRSLEMPCSRASSSLITRSRHRAALASCRDALVRSGDATLPLELRAEELRHASDELGRLTGRIDVEDLLDVIFRDFCIGK